MKLELTPEQLDDIVSKELKYWIREIENPENDPHELAVNKNVQLMHLYGTLKMFMTPTEYEWFVQERGEATRK